MLFLYKEFTTSFFLTDVDSSFSSQFLGQFIEWSFQEIPTDLGLTISSHIYYSEYLSISIYTY